MDYRQRKDKIPEYIVHGEDIMVKFRALEAAKVPDKRIDWGMKQDREQVGEQDREHDKEHDGEQVVGTRSLSELLEYCTQPKTRAEMTAGDRSTISVFSTL